MHEELKAAEENLELAAEELDVGHRTEETPESRAQREKFFAGDTRVNLEKSDTQRQAERAKRILTASLVVADASGVPSYKLSDEPHKASNSDAAKSLFDPR
ncbi:hypothetical protein [Natrononativus amylolyticus]|uniref:hypothetical protein n=1 Tax=Natrononativus amylolyticus TaxID=2963434 RepID=UPI0020CBAEC3|nr:hypothetical protein [Natrononativus amylolyticus]